MVFKDIVNSHATTSQELKEVRTFVGEHFAAIRKIILLLIIYIMQRTFRSFLFTCPCLPDAFNETSSLKQEIINSLYNRSHFTPNLLNENIIIWNNNARFRRTYTLCFLLLPAASLFLLKFSLSHDTWRVLTGCCGDRPKESILTVSSSRLSVPRIERKESRIAQTLKANATILKKLNLNAKSLINIIVDSMFPTVVWIVFCLMDGRFFVCGYSIAPCDLNNYHSITIRANSQISGWILVSSLIFVIWILKLTSAIFSKNNFYEDYFIKAYEDCETNEIERRIKLKVKSLAKQYVDVFFNLSQNSHGRWWDKLEPVQNLRRVNAKISTFQTIIEKDVDIGKTVEINPKNTKF